MKISKDTISVLKNFATVNSNLQLKEGSTLATINTAGNVFATATVDDVFPTQFGIYDLNEFLGVLSVFNEPELEFNDKFVTISDTTSSVKFFAADESVLTVPKKVIKFPTSDIEFDLTEVQLNSITKMAAVLRAPDVSIVGKDGELTFQVSDLKNVTANSYNIAVGKTDSEFTANIKLENLKLMSADYKVSISSKKISRFVSADEKITVYVALESTSSFS